MPRRFSQTIPSALLLLSFLVSGCSEGESDPTGPKGVELPFTLMLTGSASGTEGDLSISCALDLRLRIDSVEEEGGVVRWRGDHGGDVSRAVLAPDGSGLAFDAFVAGEILVEFEADGDGVRVVTPANSDTGSRFWDGLGLFEGRTTGEREGTGSWSCHPIDLNQDGYIDESGVATGSWSYRLER